MTAEQTPEERRALFRVVRGGPTDEEVVALAVVLAATGSPAAGPPVSAIRSRWSDPAARLRVPLRPGPGAWKASIWPR